VALLKRFVAAGPKDETRYRIAAALLASRDQGDAAIEIYRQGRAAIGEETLFAPELAQLEMDHGDTAAAVTEYLLLAADPERRARVWREVTILLDRVEDRAAVLARVEEMRRRHPDSVPIQDVAAMTFMQLGRYREAFAAVQEADRRAEDQGEHLVDFGRQALQGASADSVALDRARCGVEALQLLSERHPTSNLVPDATRMAAEGLVAIARVQPDEREKRALLQQAVQLIDKNLPRIAVPRFATQALALKGLILLEDLDQPAEALAIFQRVAEQQRAAGDPDQIVRVQIARCQMALGLLDQARVGLEQMAKSDSTPAPFPSKRRPPQPQQIGLSRARYYLAEMDLVAGRYEEARTGFTALAEQAPEDRLANDCLDLAMTLDESAGEDPAALQRFGAYRRALLVHDDAAERRELESLVRDVPESALAPVALYALGGVIEAERQHEAARARYEELLARYPKHRLAPRALEAIGDLQRRAFRRPDLAVQAYERLLTDYPDDLFLDGVRKKLVGARAAVRGGTHATP
jgi:tetratricopeptide (TPR) repeat protein